MSTLKLLFEIAFRNLRASVVNLIIGGIIFFATVLLVVGGSLLNTMDAAMSRSIVGSVAGHVQVYSSRSKDKLELYGGMSGESDLDAIPDFSQLKQVLEAVPNVEKVVPMGINGALVTGGNTIDLTLASLREKVNARREGRGGPELDREIDSLKAHVRHMVKLLQQDLANLKDLSSQRAVDPEVAEAVRRGLSDEFWAGFDRDPLDALEFLENQIAPQTSDADLLYVRYVGTNLDDFQRAFDRMEIVDGQPVPSGQRGFLFAKLFYENFCKVKAARRLDLMKEKIDVNGARFDFDPDLKRMAKENREQTREILYQLDGLKTEQMVARLQRALGTQEVDPGKLLSLLLDTNDQNFQERYRIFYQDVAPLIQLYRVRIGDTLTIQAFTRTGYVQSVNVKVYGTYQFKGLEKADLAGNMNLMDLMSFRDLYGYLSADKAAEIKGLKERSGAQMVERDRAEEALFGDASSTVVAQATAGVIDEAQELEGGAGALRRQDLAARVYSREEIERGVVLNAAVMLKDSRPFRIFQTVQEINAAAEKAGIPIKAVSWQEASGLLGQVVFFLKFLLYAAVFVLFIVVLVIINNAMMMATMQRVREIGTMRAIGAQRSLIRSMVLVETVVLGLVFGVAGAVAGSALVLWMKSAGIPAVNEYFYFFFSGPRLHPELSAAAIIGAFIVVTLESAASTAYPAIMATRVSPVTAMQTDE
jgi:ABC-type lipoprotein release transport system permease subunit